MLAEPQRREMLAAMGIDVYVLRGAQSNRSETVTSVSFKDWLIVATSDTVMKSPQCAQLRKSLPSILGLAPDRIRWLAADTENTFESVATANAYLVLGATLAQSLGAHLSATQQNASVIAVADEPSLSFGSAMSKRALWQTLKPIARRARELN